MKIWGGSFTYELYYIAVFRGRRLLRRVASRTVDICEVAHCPIEAGPYVISYTRYLPARLPIGSYKLKVRATAASGKLLVCILMPFTLVRSTADARGVVLET